MSNDINLGELTQRTTTSLTLVLDRLDQAVASGDTEHILALSDTVTRLTGAILGFSRTF